MKALSLLQPNASLVAIGAKHTETRSWATSYRGELAIHASARFPVVERVRCLFEPFASALVAGGVPETLWTDGSRGRGADWAALPLGAIVAVAELVGCVPTVKIGPILVRHREPVYPWSAFAPHERAFGDYSPGRYAWLFENVRPLSIPAKCRGALGLWTVPREVEAAIVLQFGLERHTPGVVRP